MTINDIDKSTIVEKVISQEGFKIIRNEATNIFKNCSTDDCWELGIEFYKSEYYQVQEIGVFLFGYIANVKNEALTLLKEEVSANTDWRIQEILAMAFDSYCKATGYEKAFPIIKEWLNDSRANVRRAVTEGLRIWTKRPFFKENPSIAIKLLSELKNDESEYVRKSVGNSIRDISKTYPDLVKEELDRWDLSSKSVNQVYKLASKLINKR
ncbi:DNA alkylation repair protein [Clostridium botulinum]|uniref:DNA alkylation repair protein n=1 Tax=Clostridium botulinum TaxID=1491 RepID=A0A6M0SRC0_CLOBO|nr:DNA alkylation repair protein [Clostridium botulinum]